MIFASVSQQKFATLRLWSRIRPPHILLAALNHNDQPLGEADAENISDEIVRVIERQIAEYSPFQVYAKALQELFKSRELPPESWEKTQSQMYPWLDQYHREAYQALLKIDCRHSISSRAHP
jgi:hypothetical protein